MLLACAALSGIGDLERATDDATDAGNDVRALDASAGDADGAIITDSSLSDVLVDSGTTAHVTSCLGTRMPMVFLFVWRMRGTSRVASRMKQYGPGRK